MILGLSYTANAQCFSDALGRRVKAVTSFYATTGTGKYKNDILWFNWGATDANATNGLAKTLVKGDYSNAEIKISDDKYICVETVVTNAENIFSAKIDQTWSAMDESYSVPGHDRYQILVTSNGGESAITLESRAFIYARNTSNSPFISTPFRLKGLILVDSESAASNEYITLTSNGEWNIIELLNESNKNRDYKIKKENVTTNSVTSTKLTMGYGVDKIIGPLAFLSFNESAYTGSEYKVSYTSTMKGNGLTSIAIGLLTPYADFGDAPESYGSPIHLVDKLDFTKDNLSNIGSQYNLNAHAISTGSIIRPKANYIGSTGPSPNTRSSFSEDAMGDDFNYIYDTSINSYVRDGLPTKEEDGWPVKNKNFSYIKMDGANMILKNKIEATIPVKINRKSILAGWIDFNFNGKFDPDELNYQIIDYTSNLGGEEIIKNIDLKWDLPEDKKNKDTYVRLRLFNYNELFPNNAVFNVNQISPTSDTYGGEVEDHKINIIKVAVTNPVLLNSANQ